MFDRCHVILACGLMLAFVARPAVGQESSFDETIDVVEVQVPVRVLKGGEPVRGLRAEDFEIYAGGERQEVVDFEVIDAGLGSEPGRRGEGGGNPGRRNMLLAVDTLFTPWTELWRNARGFERLATMELRPGDRVGLALITGGGVEIFAGLTGDPEEVRGGVARLVHAIGIASGAPEAILSEVRGGKIQDFFNVSGRPSGGTATPFHAEVVGGAASLALDSLGELPGTATHFVSRTSGFALAGEATRAGALYGYTGQATSPYVFTSADGEVFRDPTKVALLGSTLRDVLNDRVRGAFQGRTTQLAYSLADLVTLLRDVEGSKHVLLLGSGLPAKALESQAVAAALTPIKMVFARYGWTLHTIELGGVPSMLENSSTSEWGSGLYELARMTGGEALENFNRIDQAVARIEAKTSVTYLFTIRPKHHGDGKFHQLHVRLRGGPGGAKVKHRSGYVEPGSDDSPLGQTMDLLAAILGSGERRELPAAVLAPPPPPPADAELSRVPVVVEVPLAPLLDAVEAAQIEVYAYAFDRGGGALDHFVRTVNLARASLPEGMSRLHVVGGLSLPPGSHRLRLGVLDRAGRRTTLLTVPLTVPRRPLTGPFLLPPVFVEGEPDAVLAARAPGAAAAADSGPFTLGGSAFMPAVEPRVEAGASAAFVLTGYGVATPDVVFASRLRNGDGEPVGGGRIRFLSRAAAGDALQLVGRLDVAGLGPGPYELEITATDRASGLHATGAARLWVERR